MEVNVMWSAEINAESLFAFQERAVPLLRLNKTAKLNLCLDCGGGKVPIALALARFISKLGDKVTTYNLGKCNSASIVLFVAGHERLARSGCRFRFHEVGKVLFGTQTISSLENELQELRSDTRKMCKFLETRTGRGWREWRNDMNSKMVYCCKSAVQSGLATKVCDTPLKRFDVSIE